jgi:hypothetical protein
MENTHSKKHRGSCHCGAVRFAVEVDLSHQVSRCNCSVCTKVGITGKIVKPEAFALLSPDRETDLGAYEWGFRTGRRFFCKVCGIHTFLRGNLPQLGGDYVSINVNCLDDVELSDLPLVHWDGRHDNWQAGPRPQPWPILTSAA